MKVAISKTSMFSAGGPPADWWIGSPHKQDDGSTTCVLDDGQAMPDGHVTNNGDVLSRQPNHTWSWRTSGTAGPWERYRLAGAVSTWYAPAQFGPDHFYATDLPNT